MAAHICNLHGYAYKETIASHQSDGKVLPQSTWQKVTELRLGKTESSTVQKGLKMGTLQFFLFVFFSVPINQIYSL